MGANRLDFQDFRKLLQDALTRHHPMDGRAFEKVKLNGPLRTSAVLMLFAPLDQDEEMGMLITRRTDTVENHKGQMAFPGGMLNDGETLEAAALREAEEELGIRREWVEVLGALPSFIIPVSGFEVTPWVGISRIPATELALVPNPHEIERAFWVPWSVLTAEETYRRETREFQGRKFPIHVYDVDGHEIWGATGAMIRNLLERLERI